MSAHSLNRPDGETQAAPAATTGPLVILNWAQFCNFTADEWRMTILAILHEIKTECRMILIFVLKAKTKEKQAQKWILTNVFFRLKIIDQKEWRISHSNLSWWNIHITLEDFVQFGGWTRAWPTQRWALNIYIWFIWREKIFGFPQNSSTDDV